MSKLILPSRRLQVPAPPSAENYRRYPIGPYGMDWRQRTLDSSWTLTGSGSSISFPDPVPGPHTPGTGYPCARVVFAAQSARLMHAVPSGDFEMVVALRDATTLPVNLLSAPYGAMLGPAILDASGNGVCLSEYSDGGIYLWNVTAYAYATTGSSMGSSYIARPVWFWMRLKYVNGACYGSISADGTHWSTVTGLSGTFTATQFGVLRAYVNGVSTWDVGRINAYQPTFPEESPRGTLARVYGWDTTVESWTINGGTMTSSSNKLHIATSAANVALEDSGVANVADGEIIVDVAATVNTGAFGVIFRATDTSNFYMLAFESGQAARIYKRVAGTFTVINNGGAFSSSMLNVNAVRLLVRFVGTSIETYVNGILCNNFTDATFSTGRAGFYADRATLDADNMSIYTLP